MRTPHPRLVPWLDKYNAAQLRLAAAGFKDNPTNAREGLAKMTRVFVTDIPTVPWVQDDCVVTPHCRVPVRIYHPSPGDALPVLVFLHGGGHMAGSVTVYDPICRKLALATGHIVVAPEYRLAPECPYPAGLADACAVTRHVWRALDERKLRYKRVLSLGGDSAGGALTASVSGLAQFEAGLSVRRQVLIYPSLDYTLSFQSVDENAVGYMLQSDRVRWFFDHYFAQAEDRRAASPLFREFTDRLPETLLVTAGFCPLRDEGFSYAAKLRQAGVAVRHLHLDDMIHAFLNLEDLVPEACARVYDAVGDFLRA